MDPWIPRILIVVVGGLVFWTLRAYLTERTKRTKASEQYMTVEEINVHCGDEHETIGKEWKTEIQHLREIVEKEFGHGSKKFEEIKERFDKHDDLLLEINKTLVKYAKTNGL